MLAKKDEPEQIQRGWQKLASILRSFLYLTFDIYFESFRYAAD